MFANQVVILELCPQASKSWCCVKQYNFFDKAPKKKRQRNRITVIKYGKSLEFFLSLLTLPFPDFYERFIFSHTLRDDG